MFDYIDPKLCRPGSLLPMHPGTQWVCLYIYPWINVICINILNIFCILKNKNIFIYLCSFENLTLHRKKWYSTSLLRHWESAKNLWTMYPRFILDRTRTVGPKNARFSNMCCTSALSNRASIMWMLVNRIHYYIHFLLDVKKMSFNFYCIKTK